MLLSGDKMTDKPLNYLWYGSRIIMFPEPPEYFPKMRNRLISAATKYVRGADYVLEICDLSVV